MSALKLCMVAITGICAAMVVKQWKSDLLPLLRLALTLLFAFAAVSAAAPLVEYLQSLTERSSFFEYASLLFKALALAILTQCCAQICRDCGENSVANGVETVGKIQILLLSLPLMKDLFEIASTLLSIGTGS